ncbi:MAG TPA: cell division protein ZipA [Xanthomonadaceae bacterium]|nr:cell division protein ZipA [Xanthomonadaceae bacterium]
MIAAIWFLGKPRKPDQGRRVDGKRADAQRPSPGRSAGDRSEPTLGEILEEDARNDRDALGTRAEQTSFNLPDTASASDDDRAQENAMPELAKSGLLRPSLVGTSRSIPASQPTLGIRQEAEFDRIVTLYVAARAGHQLNGPDMVVAAEKAGLVHGHMSIYHRLVDGHPELGPVFSVANMVKPGNFDLTRVQEMRTPGISFFMTLPAPMLALDAWDAMLPTAQRMAELLDALVLDEERNALGRQRIAHSRDELRAYDRKREQQTIRPSR